MEFVITMIILVGLAVLFLSNVFRQAKNERERALQRSANRPRRPDSNTERFLEEVNRRRQQAQSRTQSPPVVRPVTQAPTITPLPRRELPTRKPVARTEKPRIERIPSRSPVSSRGNLLEVIPAEKPAKPAVSLEVAPASPQSELAMSARSAPPKISRQALPAAFQQLVPLLQSRQSLRAAFMLHEILGPPRCHRR
jgi:cytoskeletal protein RodZ